VGARARRTDVAHAAIRDELRQAGFSVQDTSGVGAGFPDLICSRQLITVLVEVKTRRFEGSLKKATHYLTPAQRKFHAGWHGWIITAFTTQEVLDDFKLLAKRVGCIR
jgi:Holliday junction resolvase-like predicted endonuclease